VADLFVSYSRRDGEFVDRLARSLAAHEREAWVDMHRIEDAEVFPAAIRAAIESSNGFVFVITPDSVASRFCGQEVEYASGLQKRIVPVLREQVPDEALPVEVRDRNWIPFQDDNRFEESVERLLAACDRDIELAKAHTRWLVRAMAWNNAGRDRSFLLRGSELTAIEDWLARCGPQSDPQPTEVQRAFALESRRASTRRGRTLTGAMAAMLVVAVALVIFALISRSQAVSARTSALAQEYAARADGFLTSDPQISLVFGERAVRTDPLPQSLFALRAALDASSLLDQYDPPNGIDRACGALSDSRGVTASAAYNPAGGQLAIATCDGRITLRDAQTGRVLTSRRVHRGLTGPLVYNATGSRLAFGTTGRVYIVDARTLSVQRTLPISGYASDLAFSPNGRSLAVGVQGASGNNTLTSFSVQSGRARTLVGPAIVTGIAYAGRLLAVGTSLGITELLDPQTGLPVRTLATGGLDPVSDTTVAASAGGSLLAVATFTPFSAGGLVSLWRTSDGKRIETVTSVPNVQVASMAFSPDSSRLAIGDADGSGSVWLLSADQELTTFGGQTSALAWTSFSPDGSRVATTAADGTIRVWRARGPEDFDTPLDFTNQSANAVASGPTSARALVDTGASVIALSAAPPETLRTWAVPSGRLIGSRQVPGGSFDDLSRDGRYMLVVTGTIIEDVDEGDVRVRLYSLARRAYVGSFPRPTSPYGASAWAPDDRSLFLWGNSNVDPLSATPRPEIVTVGAPRPTFLEDAPAVSQWGADAQVAYSPDGRLIAVGFFPGQVEIWSAGSRRPVQRFTEPGEISSVSINRSDTEALVGSWDGVATLWNLHTGKVIRNLIGAEGGIEDAAFTPDARYVVTASLDRTLQIWDAANGRLLRSYTLPDELEGGALSQDGGSIAAFDSAGILRVYDTCTDCQSAKGLLSLAAQRGPLTLSAREQAAINAA
jgi:WD40 repeat protein